MVQALKLASQRQRPPTDNSSGEFFDGGSFVSVRHAISAWSVATVSLRSMGSTAVSSHWLYGLATALAFLGSPAGNTFFLMRWWEVRWGTDRRFVYHKHHDQELDAPNRNSPKQFLAFEIVSSIARYITQVRASTARGGVEFRRADV